MNLCCFFSSWETKSFLSIESKEFQLTLANFMDIFKALNDLNLILQDKNINYDYDAINAFIAKLRLGIVQFKKEMHLPFQN